MITFIKDKSTGKFPYLPYWTMVCNSITWGLYGYFDNQPTVINSNVPNAILGMIYCLIYIYYAKQRNTVWQLNLILIVSLISIYFLYLKLKANVLSLILGLIGNSLSILNSFAPLVILQEIFKSECTEGISFPVAVLGFSCGLLWLLYGIGQQDVLMIVPNLMATLLNSFQLALFFIYPPHPKAKEE